MAKIIDIRTCPQCNKDYTWDYHIANRLSDGIPDAEDVDSNNAHVKCLNPKQSNPTYSFKTICPHCGQYDMFEYKNPYVK